MAGCCRARVCEEIFTPAAGRKRLRRYRRRGPDPLERQMLASIPSSALHHARVLEIGGGIGVLQAELLVGGAREGEILELLPAYEPYALELAQDKGIQSRSRFRVGDILEQPDVVASADIVVLNRVVCCSPDGIRLTGQAARNAGRILLLSFPRDRVWVRMAVRLLNGALRLTGHAFRTFVHPKSSLYAAAQNEGFRISRAGTRFVWEFAMLERAGS